MCVCVGGRGGGGIYQKKRRHKSNGSVSNIWLQNIFQGLKICKARQTKVVQYAVQKARAIAVG